MAHPHETTPATRLAPGLPPNARFDIGPARHPRVHLQRGVGIRLSDGTILSADITRPADAWRSCPPANNATTSRCWPGCVNSRGATAISP